MASNNSTATQVSDVVVINKIIGKLAHCQHNITLAIVTLQHFSEETTSDMMSINNRNQVNL